MLKRLFKPIIVLVILSSLSYANDSNYRAIDLTLDCKKAIDFIESDGDAEIMGSIEMLSTLVAVI